MKLVEVNFGVQKSLADQDKIKKEQTENLNETSAVEKLINEQISVQINPSILTSLHHYRFLTLMNLHIIFLFLVLGIFY